ncbi:MAG TPA: ArsA-related P-loop ATPase [Vicinamibacterales bacterium]|nr:ArsA-related P-loop ATPase [Vicinamibacterales bacterium]
MPSQSLFDRRLLVFSGKGGVGKSTITAATAIAAARRGKRVLIVEIGEHEKISRLFRTPPVGYAGAVVYRPDGAPPITAVCITAQEALREYGMRSVKFEMIYKAVFDNPVVRYFAAAAPGLEEMNLLGKIESLHREVIAPAPRAAFDLMLLDAPATGHAIGFFQAPRMAMRMAAAGPIYDKIERMWKLVIDPARTALNIVSLAEEMPVNESIELHRTTSELGIPYGALIVNGVYPDVFPEGAAVLDALKGPTPLTRHIIGTAKSTVARRAEQDALIGRLSRSIPGPVITTPLIVCPRIEVQDVELLAGYLEALHG